MCPIAGSELRQNVGDSAFDGCLRDGQDIGNLLVRIASRDKPQNINFAFAQCFIPGVFSELGGNLRRDYLSSRIDGMNRFDKFPIVPFQEVGPRASSEARALLEHRNDRSSAQ
jgi:hypothetical protein